jgi:hypothetical protein
MNAGGGLRLPQLLEPEVHSHIWEIFHDWVPNPRAACGRRAFRD